MALAFGSPFAIAVFMGMITATGGGMIRDVLTQTRPMIMCGEIYATATLVGSLGYATLVQLTLSQGAAALLAFLAAFSLRAAAIIFSLRLEPRAELGRTDDLGGGPRHDTCAARHCACALAIRGVGRRSADRLAYDRQSLGCDFAGNTIGRF